uniref:Uncharacterized LOC103189828 n=1 Tax=Callorhinchus milii TaxID=7868 RepID=A0A4W3HQ34_CALMI
MESTGSFIAESRGLELPGKLDLGLVTGAGSVRGQVEVALRSPRERVPSERRRFLCLECGRRFTQASSLLRHRRVHTGERPFLCQVCGKGFIQASDLVKHSRVHSGERAFWCSQCGKSFRQPETLAKHPPSSHTRYIMEGGNYLTPKTSHWGNPGPCSQRDRLVLSVSQDMRGRERERKTERV